MRKSPIVLEKDVKSQIKIILRAHTIWYFMPQNYGMGVSGVPDFICCKDGLFFAIEAKGSHGVLSELQKIQIDAIQKCRGKVFVITPENISTLPKILESLGA